MLTFVICAGREVLRCGVYAAVVGDAGGEEVGSGFLGVGGMDG